MVCTPDPVSYTAVPAPGITQTIDYGCGSDVECKQRPESIQLFLIRYHLWWKLSMMQQSISCFVSKTQAFGSKTVHPFRSCQVHTTCKSHKIKSFSTARCWLLLPNAFWCIQKRWEHWTASQATNYCTCLSRNTSTTFSVLWPKAELTTFSAYK